MKKWGALVFILVFLAVALRVRGLDWGLPNDLHFYSYHPDENMVLGAALNVDVLSGQLDPGFYNYGSLYIYLVNAALFFASGWGILSLAGGDISTQVGELAKMYLTGRLVALMLGVLTVYLTYTLGRRAFGMTTGLLAAFFMAVMPLSVMHSKFLAVDVTAAFFVTLALIFALRIPQEGFRLRDYLFAGLFVGLAAATKYNAGLVILAPIAAHIAACRSDKKRRALNLGVFALVPASLGAFVLGTPGILLNTEAFLRDFTYELLHARTGHGLVFTDTGLGWIYHFTNSLQPGMGLPLLLLATLGVAYALKKRTPADWAILAFLLAYYLLIGAAQVRFARYVIPLLPMLAVLAARLSADLFQRLRENPRLSSRLAACGVMLALAGVTMYSLACSAWANRMFAERDTRDLAAEWIASNIPRGESIGFATIPWFYTPPLDPSVGMAARAEERYDMALEIVEYDIMVSRDKDWDADFLADRMPDYVVLSEFEYTDRRRLRDPDALRYFEFLEQNYRLVHRQEYDPRCPHGTRYIRSLPHDMSYASPEILIYSRNPGGEGGRGASGIPGLP